MRTVDKSKKSNIKCEHCEYSAKSDFNCFCILSGKVIDYWRKCEFFEWSSRITYKK